MTLTIYLSIIGSDGFPIKRIYDGVQNLEQIGNSLRYKYYDSKICDFRYTTLKIDDDHILYYRATSV